MVDLEMQKNLKPSKRDRINPADRPADERIQDFNEVNLGFTDEEAVVEAERCANCKDPKCVKGCPVGIDIPKFIMDVKAGDIESAYKTIQNSHAFPCVTGRVCPQETQCESNGQQ